jgi:hypothetical protein
VFSS